VSEIRSLEKRLDKQTKDRWTKWDDDNYMLKFTHANGLKSIPHKSHESE